MIENGYLQRWFLIIFALFCIGINVIAFVLYEKNATIADAKQWLAHTYKVITEEYKIFASMQDMQTTHRTYLITGKNEFLVPYQNARKIILESMAPLEALVKDNPSQTVKVKENNDRIRGLIAITDEQVGIKQESGVSVENMDFSRNRLLADEIRGRHTEIVNTEYDLLQKRNAEVEARQKNYVTTLFSTAALSALGLLIANALVAFLTFRRKTAEDDLRRTNKEMEGFTYIASHDLRSPLVNLKGFATEMKYSIDELRPYIEKSANALSEPEQKKATEILDHDIPDALHYIHSSVVKMDKLTNAILELSRLGRRHLDLKQISTTKIVRHILDTLHHTIVSKQIQVTMQPLPDVIADQLSLEQVFGNIIDNAIKYLDPARPGELEIGGVKTYRETKFWVRDNGRGISSADMNKIFEIYRRAGNTESIPGEGMGMAYVRTTLRRLGGQVWAESSPGIGTIFYFTISNSLKQETDKKEQTK